MPRPRQTSWPLQITVLVTFGIAAAMLGALLLETEQEPARAAQATAATMTPTPRVIVIAGTTTPPATAVTATPRPPTTTAPTAAPTRAPTQSEPSPTPTPWMLVAETTTPTPAPGASTTALPEATSTPRPTATPRPPTATPPPPLPTIAPARTATTSPVITETMTQHFAASDWTGGFYRGDGLAYGRPWVAVYGRFSDYPRATLTFSLDRAPAGPASLLITGLDDEWLGANPITLSINDEEIFSGPAPFADWDGVGDGANAAWMTVEFPIPEGLLAAGNNEIAFANLSQSGNFNAPPYVLLAEATLELETPVSSIPPIAPANAGRGNNGASGQAEASEARAHGRQHRDKPRKVKQPKKEKTGKRSGQKQRGKKHGRS